MHTPMERLQEFWGAPIPRSFAALYTTADGAELGTVEFYPLGMLLGGHGREPGMLPQFLPFADTWDGEIAGFYVPATGDLALCPVLLWDREEDYYFPVALSFDTFLAWGLLVGLYLLNNEAEAPDEAVSEWRLILRRAGLPDHLLGEPVPQNERELNERLAKKDIAGPAAILHLAAAGIAQGDLAGALRRLEDAEGAVPWFGDVHYLRAEALARRSDEDAALDEWLRTLACLRCLATHTDRYDLGPDAPDEYIPLQAKKEIRKRLGMVRPDAAADPIWLAVTSPEDTEEARFHLELAATYARLGRSDAEERELLNALTAARDEAALSAAYERLIAFYTAQNRPWEAERCRRDRDLLDRRRPLR
ncbi:MAG: SMI1/KNR4 family protein [Chthonomonadales bacterium]